MLKKLCDLKVAQQTTDANSKNRCRERSVAERNRAIEAYGAGRVNTSCYSLHRKSISRMSSQQQGGNRETRACFTWSKVGHLSIFCPHPRRRANADVQLNDERVQSLHVNGTSESSRLNCASYLHAVIGNRTYDCLLDTGSDVCLIP